MTITDERLAEMVGAGVPRVPAQPGEIAAVVQELRALRSKPVASGVEVKPLIWHGPDVNGDIHARSILAVYTIRKQQGSLGYWLTEVGGYHSTIEKAKTAAEADYRQRILSALLPKATAPVVSKGEQRTICEACGNSNLAHSRAIWTDDGSSFCPACAPQSKAVTEEMVEWAAKHLCETMCMTAWDSIPDDSSEDKGYRAWMVHGRASAGKEDFRRIVRAIISEPSNG